MKIKNFLGILFVVLIVAAFAVAPAFAQGETPPIVEAPVFDWAAISSALQALVIAFLVPLAGFLARWLFAVGSYQKAQLSEQQNWVIDNAFKTFVFAAEQMKLAGYIDDKLDWVIDRAEMWLTENEIIMDLEGIRARIEAIVAKELNLDKLTAPKGE